MIRIITSLIANSMVASCSSMKTRDFSSLGTDNHHLRSFFITKSCHDIAKISAHAFTAIAQKPGHQVIVLWPRDFKELEAQDRDQIERIMTSFYRLPQILQPSH